ncbi:hypothetical protein BJ508DRAFT_367502 [Ascobolus immersus RN42]|uniref:Uncharacterized protein n=1 Tax=Ascobolus immersus RN42 TaxID=1160509 RepID=A0A3N4HGN9_ASCIM|nr:hypothetical protein BJ508DRAFT_367502 [Ascobolus immersus RN42]
MAKPKKASPTRAMRDSLQAANKYTRALAVVKWIRQRESAPGCEHPSLFDFKYKLEDIVVKSKLAPPGSQRYLEMLENYVLEDYQVYANHHILSEIYPDRNSKDCHGNPIITPTFKEELWDNAAKTLADSRMKYRGSERDFSWWKKELVGFKDELKRMVVWQEMKLMPNVKQLHFEDIRNQRAYSKTLARKYATDEHFRAFREFEGILMDEGKWERKIAEFRKDEDYVVFLFESCARFFVGTAKYGKTYTKSRSYETIMENGEFSFGQFIAAQISDYEGVKGRSGGNDSNEYWTKRFNEFVNAELQRWSDIQKKEEESKHKRLRVHEDSESTEEDEETSDCSTESEPPKTNSVRLQSARKNPHRAPPIQRSQGTRSKRRIQSDSDESYEDQ